jgi:hypothetical protein
VAADDAGALSARSDAQTHARRNRLHAGESSST